MAIGNIIRSLLNEFTRFKYLLTNYTFQELSKLIINISKLIFQYIKKKVEYLNLLSLFLLRFYFYLWNAELNPKAKSNSC